LNPRSAPENAALFDTSFSVNEEIIRNMINSKLSKSNCNNFNFKVSNTSRFYFN
jgi:hypothetical protein